MNIYESHNGGKTYTTISPGDPFPRFISPIVTDPTNSDHIVALGQKVWETTKGYATTKSDWSALYDLGGVRQGTAGSVYGNDMYVGWCGPCNPANFTAETPFESGLVSNVGGSWHELAAKGLPNRYITSVVQDPSNNMHIYVTLSGYSRNWIPGGSMGHVFESTDGGKSFKDISGGPAGCAGELRAPRGREPDHRHGHLGVRAAGVGRLADPRAGTPDHRDLRPHDDPRVEHARRRHTRTGCVDVEPG